MKLTANTCRPGTEAVRVALTAGGARGATGDRLSANRAVTLRIDFVQSLRFLKLMSEAFGKEIMKSLSPTVTLFLVLSIFVLASLAFTRL